MIVTGVACVVIGGLVAAATDPLDFSDGSWLAAYLVLVGGVAQSAMGLVRDRLEPASERSPAWGWAQFGGWNLGNAAVIAGTLASATLLVDAGSVLLVLALLIALRATWNAARRRAGPLPPIAIWIYRVLLLILIVSIPVGILLSHLRNA